MQEEQLPERLPGSQAGRDLERVNPLAAGVLQRNGIKSWTKPAPSLYPHQWSWDSAFIALGLAHVDNRRARDELEIAFREPVGNWQGAPHSLQPGGTAKELLPRRRALELRRPIPGRPFGFAYQRPVPAAGARHCRPEDLGNIAGQGRRRGSSAPAVSCAPTTLASLPGTATWRRPGTPKGPGSSPSTTPGRAAPTTPPAGTPRSGPSRSGTCPPTPATTSSTWTDPSHRPTDAEYDRYLWLLELLKRGHYDEAEIYESHPFLVKDVLFSAILVAANEALVEIARVVGAPEEDVALGRGVDRAGARWAGGAVGRGAGLEPGPGRAHGLIAGGEDHSGLRSPRGWRPWRRAAQGNARYPRLSGFRRATRS